MKKVVEAMKASKSQDSAASGNQAEKDELRDAQGNSGAGAASALERMKAEHASRRKHQHGTRSSGPGHEEDRTPER